MKEGGYVDTNAMPARAVCCAVCRVPCAVCRVPCAVCCVLCAVCCVVLHANTGVLLSLSLSLSLSHSMANPRHPNTMCHTCLGRHVEVRLESGKLFVVCPFEDCGRTLQTAEVKTFAKPAAYDKLIERLREAEEAAYADSGGAADRAALAGLELRLCPKCKVRIEKNEGCDQMSCYRCGSRFQWSSAEPAFRPEAVPSAADGFQFGSGGASPADGGAAFPAFSADAASFGGVGFSFGAPVATNVAGSTSTMAAED